MTRRRKVVLLALVAAASLACASSGGGTFTPAARVGGPEPFGVYPPRNLRSKHPLTRAERSDFTETSTSADVDAFIDSLATNRWVSVTSMGKTTKGRDIPLLVLSRPAVRNAAEAKRLNRPIVYIQGDIHGGEVEGKEALLSVLRDLAQDTYQNVLDSLVILAAPVYNADGNDAMGPEATNRPEQNGPALVGQRANGQGLDLNRDYVKAEAPETRAALDFFRAWDPDVFIDLHTTDGSFHGYALTWAPPLNPAARFSGPFTRDTMLPAIQLSLRINRRMETFPYGNFRSQDSVAKGWFTFDHRPRFGTNYYGLRGRMAILAETYSHDPFRTRVSTTYSFLLTALSTLALNADDVMEVGREADRLTTAFASMGASTARFPIRAEITRTPRFDDVLVQSLVRTGDTVRYEAGLPPGVKRGDVRHVRIPIYDRFDSTLTQSLPYAWVIPAEQAPILDLLRRHGLFIERPARHAAASGERFVIDSVIRAGRPFQGHNEARLVGRWERVDSLDIGPDAYVVRAGQPLAILALYLMEPQSDDGLVTWNVMDPWLQAGARYPIVRVLDRIPAPLHAAP